MVTDISSMERDMVFNYFFHEYSKPSPLRNYRAIKYDIAAQKKLHAQFEYCIDWKGVKEYYDPDGEIRFKPI